MIIEFTREQEALLLGWAKNITIRHIDAEAEPPGYELIISVSSYGHEAEAVCGTDRIDLGCVTLTLSQPAVAKA